MYRKKTKGFSLLEAMISVFLVSFGIVAILPLLSTGISETFGSRDQMTAALLAQEGIEIMRNIRDNHWTSDTGFPSPDFDNGRTGKAKYNSNNLSNSNCNGNSCQIYMKNNFYDIDSSGTPTKFYRKIEVRNSGSAKKITSTVIWSGSSFPSLASCTTINKCVYSEVELTNWGS